MNPLTLPEFRVLIGPYLTIRDILTCILVCQDWYQDFKPLLYRSIRLDEATLRIIPKETLRKHAHLFRHLVIVEPMRLSLASIGPWGSPAKFGNPACISSATWAAMSDHQPSFRPQSSSLSSSSPTYTPNLLSLDIHPSNIFRKRVHEHVPKHKVLTVGTDKYDIVNDDFWCLQSTDACIRLIKINQNLQSLTETWDDMSSFHRIRFTNQLCQLQNRLIRMHLNRWEVTPEMLNQLIENSPMLDVLRFSKLIVKKGMGIAVGLKEERPQQSEAVPPPVLNFRQLRVFAVSHAVFQLPDLNIEAPSLIVLCLSFSQVNYTQPNFHFSSAALPPSSHQYSRQPKVFWNTPLLEKLICNRTEMSVTSLTLCDTPHALRTLSIANYDIESRLISQFITAQGLQLESIRLACFSGISARDIRLILTRCPNLVNLSAPEIMFWAGDLVNVQPQDEYTKDSSLSTTTTGRIGAWTCSKLERLSVYLCLDEHAVDEASGSHENPYQQHHFPRTTSSSDLMPACPMDIDKIAQQAWQQPMQRHMQTTYQQEKLLQDQCQNQHHHTSKVHIRNALLAQLAALTRLRHLDLSGEHVENADQVEIGLPWTLNTGLQRMSSLQNLEHIAVTGWIDDMGIPELEWMKSSWLNLKRISLLKTNPASMNRFKKLVADVWPTLRVQHKDRNNAHCSPLYL